MKAKKIWAFLIGPRKNFNKIKKEFIVIYNELKKMPEEPLDSLVYVLNNIQPNFLIKRMGILIQKIKFINEDHEYDQIIKNLEKIILLLNELCWDHYGIIKCQPGSKRLGESDIYLEDVFGYRQNLNFWKQKPEINGINRKNIISLQAKEIVENSLKEFNYIINELNSISL